MSEGKKRLDCTKIKDGDLMAFVYYAKVKSKAKDYALGNDQVLVTNIDTKQDFQVHGKELIEDSFSADQWVTESKITQTDMIQILIQSYNRPFTVVFDKDDGSERKLRGRLIKPDPLRGRSMVEDLDIDKGTPVREVNHRTLKSLIVDGYKYTLKK